MTAALEGDPDGIIMDTGAVYVMENLKTLAERVMNRRADLPGWSAERIAELTVTGLHTVISDLWGKNRMMRNFPKMSSSFRRTL